MDGSLAGGLRKRFVGSHEGALLIAGGLVMAVAAAVLVLRLAAQSRDAARQGVPLVYVVMATKEIPEHTPVRADAVEMKAFPAAFAPQGAAQNLEQVVGKYAATHIVPEQVVLSSQVSATTTQRAAGLSATIPPGKVVFWLALPDVLARSGGLQSGDFVDILLSLPVSGDSGARPAGGLGLSASGAGTGVGAGADARQFITQTTLQDVEVFFVGTAGSEPNGTAAPAARPGAAAPDAPKTVTLLLTPQDALLAKYVKDSGGIIDLVLRQRGAHEPVVTEPITADHLTNRFGFPAPQTAPAGGRR